MLAVIFLLLGLLFQAPGQGQVPGQQPSPTPTTQQARPTPSPTPEVPPVVTRHEIHVGGSTTKYTAIAGMMPIRTARVKPKRACSSPVISSISRTVLRHDHSRSPSMEVQVRLRCGCTWARLVQSV